MEFGFNVPLRGPMATAGFIGELAVRGEALGFTHIAVPDHLVIPQTIDSVYPYSDTGAFPGQDSGDTLEQLTIMTWIAALTQRVRVLSSVMVVPHRGAVLTAKMLSTLDVMSGGRLTVGVGAGWLREEFEAVDAPDFDARGRVTDEYLDVFIRVWTEASPNLAGEFVHMSGASVLPHPVQDPHPPIWVGGESRAAMRRAVRVGSAWYPIGVNPAFPLNTRTRYAAALGRLGREAEARQRDPASVGLAYWANWYDERRPVVDVDGERHLFTGNDEQVKDDIHWMRERGVTDLLFNFVRSEESASFDAMARCDTELLGDFKG
jgi:probable F420-dependent oxidoreductase